MKELEGTLNGLIAQVDELMPFLENKADRYEDDALFTRVDRAIQETDLLAETGETAILRMDKEAVIRVISRVQDLLKELNGLL